MSKGLEELKKPCDVNIPFDESENEYTYTQKQVNVIEKELKEYEEIKAYMQQYEIENNEELRRVLHNNWVARQKFKTDNANVIKALEIIKEHPMFYLHDDLPQGTYRIYDCELYSHYDLTKEEYDLLKEVLL